MPSSALYHTNEVTLALPDADYVDSTVNAIRLPRLDAALIIGRGKLAESETLESSIDQQMQRLGQQVKDLHYSAKQPVRVGPGADLSGFEMQSRFVRGGESVYQYQLAMLVPGTRTMLAVTYSRPAALTERDAAHWTLIKSGLNFRTIAQG